MTQEKTTQEWSANPEQSDPDKSQTMGHIFQRARQKKKQSIDEVAHATRIPAETIQAIESGSREMLPVAVFTKGFVKIYAAHLGLDQADILEKFNNEWGGTSPAPPSIRANNAKLAESSPFLLSSSFYLILLIIALLASLAYFFFQADATPMPTALGSGSSFIEAPQKQLVLKKEERPQVKTLPTLVTPEIPLISPESAGKIPLENDVEQSGEQNRVAQGLARDQQTIVTTEKSASPLAQVAATVEPDRPLPQELSSVSPPPPPSMAVAQAALIPSAPPEAVDLHIRFVKKTRITVAQDDNSPEKFIFAPGEESTWQAIRHITLEIDEADAVELTLNGSPVTLAGNHTGSLLITLPTDLDR